MCHKKSPPDVRKKNKASSSNTAIAKRSKSTVSLKPPHRKTRTKIRKPKYLSLRLQLSPKTSHSKKYKSKSIRTVVNSAMADRQQHQLNLFPLHPDHGHDHDQQDDEDDDRDEHDVALLFNNSEGSATLNGLLGSDSSTTTTCTATPMSSEEDSFSPPASVLPSYARFDCVDNARSLVRTAMRSKGRDARGERWVCYSEVVEKQEQTEEATSANSVVSAIVKKEKEEQYNYYHYWYSNYSNLNNSDNPTKGCGKRTTLGSLSLKLDYQEILNAWSDKGPWYIDGESPQTVPELREEILSGGPASSFSMDGWGSCSVGNVWSVPESGVVDGNDIIVKEVPESMKNWKTEKRAESVLRYKEKRQSRLFSKRIRYEVRKLNAEKRPRMKGRFVKR